MIRKLSCMTAIMLMMAPGYALAAETVSVRTGDHDGYSRLVFDWGQAVPYKIKRNGDRLEISFARAATLDKSGAPTDGDLNIKGISQIAGGDNDLTVAVDLTPGADYRDFLVGSRVIIDVMDLKGAPNSVMAKPAPVFPPVPPKADVAEAAPVDEPATAPDQPAHVITGHEGPDVPAQTVENVKQEELPQRPLTDIEKAIPAIEPHVVTVSSTESVGMAAFERFGTLWIVVDKPGFTVPPQIGGPQKDQFKPFHRMDLKNATVFTTALPADAAKHLYGEGGGLVWRVVMTPVDRPNVEPVMPERSFGGKDDARGGKIFWPLRKVTKVIELTDPSIGDHLTVMTVKDSGDNTGERRDFVDFTALRAPIGMAISAKVDDLQITQNRNGVTINRPAGLALSHVSDVNRSLIREQVQPAFVSATPDPSFKRIFDFDRWMMGGLQALTQNQQILLGGMADKDASGRVQDILSLAKMNIANDRGQEAVGFLNFAAMELPDIEKSPEYLALRGAAEALAGKYELAWRDLNDPSLKDYKELDYWRAYTLAWLEDWQQAGQVMPDDYTVLVGYPKVLLEKLGTKLAEIALRKNEVPKAEAIITTLEKERGTLQPQTIAAIDYLKGQAARQKGDTEATRKLWTPLLKGNDDFYRARAGLALTMLEYTEGNIKLDQAIDRLEGLRYAWRGDELEAQINFMLGKLYLDKKEYMKGFNILRDAASMSPDSDVSKEITRYMADAFRNLMLNEDDLSPQDAVMVYEEFKELTPADNDGNLLAQHLAERLVEADLLTRAAAILQHQIDFRIGGEEQARVATRLAAIYLLDRDPKPALKALDKAQAYYETQTDPQSQAQLRKDKLLRARALSQNNQTEEAVELLNTFPPDPDVNRLRADIAWQAGLWEDAAEALHDLILDQALDKGRPLTEDQASLILNRAVALNLAGDRVELSNMLNRFGDAMKKTSRGEMFTVVTRPRKSTIIADKNTIEQIVSEVDMFKGFLDEYRSDVEPPAPQATVPAPAAVPATTPAAGTN